MTTEIFTYHGTGDHPTYEMSVRVSDAEPYLNEIVKIFGLPKRASQFYYWLFDTDASIKAKTLQAIIDKEKGETI
ncbi:MAG: hypothetical protein KKF27_21135 [Gammaproteobacteria bacterium]|nr:hypothetical protein [Gammaproteobacteria bacterium]